MGDTTTAAVSTFQTQFQTFMYYAGPIAQLIFWAVLAVAAIYAVVLYKRYVDFATGKPAKAEKQAEDKAVSVDEFVD